MTAVVPRMVLGPTLIALVIMLLAASKASVIAAEGVTVIASPPPSGARVIRPSLLTSKSVKSMTAVAPRMVLAPRLKALTMMGLDRSTAVVVATEGVTVRAAPSASLATMIRPSLLTSKSVKSITAVVP